MQKDQNQSTIRRRTGGRSARITEAVTEALLTLLVSKGPAGLTMADIAERSGVHPTTLYRRWQSVERLVLEVALAAAEREVPVPDFGSLRQDLEAMFIRLGRQITSPLGRSLLLLSIGQGPSESADAFWRQRIETMAVILTRAEARGEIRLHDQATALLSRILAELYMQHFILGKAWTDDRLAAPLADHALQILGR
jgi:AcrR family transcriptional regulator